MFQIRATKYDPRHRAADGRYLASEWTSVANIGKTIGGKLVTPAEYLASEDVYVEAVRRLIRAAGIDSLQITRLEVRSTGSSDASSIELIRPTSCIQPTEGLILHWPKIDACVRLALRESIWCELWGEFGTYVHFGYDYYMYVGCRAAGVVAGEPPPGMFYEPCPSPYEAHSSEN